MDDSSVSLLENPNPAWLNSRGSWLSNLVVILSIRIGLAVIPGLSAETQWTLTNLIYNATTFIMFHWITGIPFDFNQNECNGLTLWEQIDDGTHYTPTKKYLTAVPIILFLVSTHYSHYNWPSFIVNLVSVLIVTMAKLPIMHKVRIFSINKSYLD